VCAEIFQIEINENALIGLDVLVLDEGALISHGQQEAVILVLEAHSVGDGLVSLQVIPNISEQRPILGQRQNCGGQYFLSRLASCKTRLGGDIGVVDPELRRTVGHPPADIASINIEGAYVATA